ncbi:UNVERIFIED_CONTAM: hypothetical protein Slati_3799200 [Sesamum latifolium]|uniref:CCHC-type domain-containing protein n=1 Tax=Sesamum latifolium TaxID=2727402 RepID=A0AAW2U6Y7_9LAMI
MEEEEVGWVVLVGLWHSEPLTRGFYIVGRLVSSKSFHPKAPHTTLRAAFNPVRGMEFKVMDEEQFLIKFFHILDHNRVLERCPWAYDKNLLVLAPVEAEDDPKLVDLSRSDLHIHIHGLPLGKMTKEVASFIGNKLGKFKKVDLDSKADVWESSVCIRVSLDITKPLKRALKIRMVLGDEQLVTFTYERLLNFCYLCGCLGHLSRQCEIQLHDGFCDPDDNSMYGNWLRVAAPSSYRTRVGAYSSREVSGASRRPTFVSRSSLQSQSVRPPPPIEVPLYLVVLAHLPQITASSMITPHRLFRLPWLYLPLPRNRYCLTTLIWLHLLLLPHPQSPLYPPHHTEPPSGTLHPVHLSPPCDHRSPIPPLFLPHQPASTPSSPPDIPPPCKHPKKANPNPRPISHIVIASPNPIFSQKRHLADENSSDELETQGLSKSCRLIAPLLDVTNLEAATAGQSRHSP